MELKLKASALARLREIADQLLPGSIGNKSTAPSEHFLPNFCEGKMVLSVIIIAEMLALIISLVMPIPSVFFTSYFEALLQISIFIQWIALSCAFGLCVSRRYLMRLPNYTALIIAYLILLMTTLLVNELAVWLLYLTGKIGTPRPVWYAHLHFQNLSVSAIINALMLGYFLTKQELTQKTASEARAKIEALQTRIRPHFVFNAMNIIASLTRSDPKKAEQAIEDMAELFRMMLNEEETMVPIKKEVDVAKKYLALEELRLDARLQVIWDEGKFPRKAIMPTLTLQPLLEYAINEGIEAIPTGGAINITLWEEDDIIRIRIKFPVPRKRKTPTKKHVGLDNIRQRFESHYGDKATLRLEEQDGWAVISLTLPVRDRTMLG